MPSRIVTLERDLCARGLDLLSPGARQTESHTFGYCLALTLSCSWRNHTESLNVTNSKQLFLVQRGQLVIRVGHTNSCNQQQVVHLMLWFWFPNRVSNNGGVSRVWVSCTMDTGTAELAPWEVECAEKNRFNFKLWKNSLGYYKELSIFVVPRLVAHGDLEGDGSVASVRSSATWFESCKKLYSWVMWKATPWLPGNAVILIGCRVFKWKRLISSAPLQHKMKHPLL